MYSCHITFYYIGHQQDICDLFRDIPPLEPYTHSFMISEAPQSTLAAQADVIFADLRDLDAANVFPVLSAVRKPVSQLIALAAETQGTKL